MSKNNTIGKKILFWWVDYFSVLKSVSKGLSCQNITILSSGLVYSTLIALVPCLTFLFSFLTSFGALQIFLDVLLQWLSSTFGYDTANALISEVSNYSSNAMSLGVIGLVSFLFTGILLVSKIYNVINQIFKTRVPSVSFKRYGTFFIFLVVFSFLISLAFGLSSTLLSRIEAYMNNIEISLSITQILRKIGSFALIWFTLFLFLIAVPSIKVRKGSAAVGAFTGLFFISILNLVFNSLVSKMVSYWTIYGTIASVFIVLLYLYYFWYIIILVSEVTYVHQFRPDKNTLVGLAQSPRKKIEEAMNLFLYIAKRYKEGKGPSNIREMSKSLAIPYSRISEFVRELDASGFVIATNSQYTSFVPSRPLESILVKDLVRVLYGIESDSSAMIENIGEAVSAELYHNGEKGFSSLTVENLLERI